MTTTSMLDALAAESAQLAEDTKRASILVQGVLTRSAALSQQIDVLIAEGERLVGGDAEIISSFATVDEFAEFQSRHFPYQKVRSALPAGSYPATQDDGQGNQGSAAAQATPPSGARGPTGEAEQGVTAEASEERVAPRVDPEAAPEPTESLKDRALDLYAAENLSQRLLCERVGCGLTTFQHWLTTARRNGDQRAAKGDLLRAEAKEVVRAEVVPASARPIASLETRIEDDVELDISAAAGPLLKDGEVCSINQNTCVVSRDAKAIQLARHEMRMVRALNSGAAITLEDMFAAAGVLTGRRLDAEVGKLNPRIAMIGITIVKTSAGEFQLHTDR